MFLYIVATPIGNLKDISQRVLETLRSVDLILCEDTRVTAKLLNHFEIRKPLQSYHQHSQLSKAAYVLEELKKGKNIALVADAGTPGISDPGNKLISYLVAQLPSLKIVPIPGPCAAIAALSVSGFPADKFVFLGFPPHKKGRETFFKELANEEKTAVFYESPHRIEKCLEQLKEFLPADRKIAICRELTKMFETIYRGTIGNVTIPKNEIKGEFVVVVKC
jgi:16S rRNA (cytidine1402-2'-O)-methyltransferase